MKGWIEVFVPTRGYRYVPVSIPVAEIIGITWPDDCANLPTMIHMRGGQEWEVVSPAGKELRELIEAAQGQTA